MAAALKVPLSIIRQPFALRSCATVRTITGLSAFTLQAPSLYLLRQRYARHYSASLNEEASARLADDSAESVAPTIFDKIISKEIPSSIVYEDDRVLAFRDIDPQAPVHVLVIPKIRDGLTQLGKAEIRHAEILGHLLYAAKVVAAKEGIEDGFRVVINNGPSACQSVYHLHLHVLGGRQMNWPPG
ncbi:14 kDa zinc-binding protein-like isoform X1 [Phalaenopsis equestris]|uniref:14 kDa zinc-binding protein-like isoform X1 n=1 Tax=Phalaenopsis equestris TaxID=78828 RepID=UPI0009E297A2|nr:14 kDa zinc-binding protein-like isoform X1 [Phalaenopsis equestris]